MNENIQANELTFQKVFNSLKRSFVRIVIYAIIAAVLGGGISAIVTLASKGSVEYTTIIEYNYTGVEDGKDPLDNVLDTSKIKSILLVNNALVNMGVKTEYISDYGQILVDSIAVNGYVSSKMATQLLSDETLEYFPTRYIITLTENSSLAFKDTQYIQFLNELVIAYVDYFEETYDYGTILSLSVADNALALANDYIDLSVEYKTAISKMLVELETLKNNATEKYNKIYSNITALNNELNSIETYILSNNVVKSTAPVTLSENLTAKKVDYTNLSGRYGDLADKLFTEVISNYINSSSTITTDGGLITIKSTESAAYDSYIKEYNSYRSNQYLYTYEAEQIDSKIAILSSTVCTTAQITEVERRFTEFDVRLNATLDSANAELEEYSEENVTDNGVSTAMAASKVQTVSYSLIFVVALVCAFVGVIAAIVVTEIKRRKAITAEGNVPVAIIEK